MSDAISDTPALSTVILAIYNDSGQRAWFFKNACGASMAFQYSRNPSTTAERIPAAPRGIPNHTNVWKGKHHLRLPPP